MNGSGSSETTGLLLGCARKRSWSIGHITRDAKQTGERRTGNPFAPFDEAGAGNGLARAPRQSSTLPVTDRTWQHHWLRIERLIRSILETRWDNKT